MSALRRPSPGALPRVLPGALPRLLTGFLLAALVLLAGAAVLPQPAHAAGSGLDTVAESLKKSPVYVDPRVRDQLPDADRDALARKIRDAGKPVFVAVLPDAPEFPRTTLMRNLRTKVGITGVYAVHIGAGGFNAGADRQVLPHNAVYNLKTAAQDSHRGDTKGMVTDFAQQAAAQARGEAPSSWAEGDGGDGGSATGLLVGGAVVVAGGVGGYALLRRARKRREERERAELEALRVVVDEDITAFGEELDRLDFNPSEPGATDAMRTDYTGALDAYDLAKTRMAEARRPEDVRPVTEALQDGRFALATLAARRTGAPLPERRLPCFFDPRHGPSTTDVQWAPPGGAPRPVPACAADATRVADGLEPMTRTVRTAGGPQPYWDAGPAYSPWAGGYFGGGSVLTAMVAGTVLGSVLSAPSAFADSPSFFNGPEGGTESGADFNPADFGGGFGDGGGFDGGGFDGGDW
ncbi:hypothetical protein K2224_30695 (plasmid) [Streptomyces sp. BHT-5-2]|uniref:hypothetical protein n=1 Tax=Streptomyces sp. BHT-5-2 TaxID=2866715 RepID=UPI001C8E4684|nr:hypothetical protein [Streptomyces sp. BHT-5-2]QZL07615.1 hypothetical protein K2224_30695 [Streptomyces sp. BHT-5-2]